MNSEQILISIVIATYNSEATLEAAIQSVLDQQFKDYELIIIDGNSSDNTIGIIKKYEHGIKYWISEPDAGIYDAWNKGLKATQGKWVCFLGSDDMFLSGALSAYSEFLIANSELDYVSSRVELFWEKKGVNQTRVIGDKWNWNVFKRKMNVAHVGSMHNRKIYDRYGNYNTNYKIASDYELLLRIGNKLNAGFIKTVTVKMRFGGVSTKQIFKTLKETRDIKLFYNLFFLMPL